jgi:uncharacterized coiled-coil protein SlyX
MKVFRLLGLFALVGLRLPLRAFLTCLRGATRLAVTCHVEASRVELSHVKASQGKGKGRSNLQKRVKNLEEHMGNQQDQVTQLNRKVAQLGETIDNELGQATDLIGDLRQQISNGVPVVDLQPTIDALDQQIGRVRQIIPDSTTEAPADAQAEDSSSPAAEGRGAEGTATDSGAAESGVPAGDSADAGTVSETGGDAATGDEAV